MALSLTINGTTYSYPEVDDEGWGEQATLWAQAVTQGMLQLAGGNFPLASEVDFGNVFGIRAKYLRSKSNNPATADVVRLANLDSIDWRNAANSANTRLFVDASDKLIYFDGTNSFDLTQADVKGPGSSTDNALVRFDGTSGTQIQNSGAILNDADALTGLSSLDTLALSIGGVAITNLFIDVIGSSTDNALTRWDGTSGKQVQNSNATLTDAGLLTLAAGLTVTTGPITLSPSSILLNATFANGSLDAITRSSGASVGVRGAAISSSSGAFNTASTSFTDVTNLSVQITTLGRPVLIVAIPDTGGTCYVGLNAVGGNAQSQAGQVAALVDASNVGIANFQAQFVFASDSITFLRSGAALTFMAFPSAGVHTIKLQAKVDSANMKIEVKGYKLFAIEL